MSFLRKTVSPIAGSTEFQAAYEHNRLSVFRYVYSLTGGPQAHAEDLTAETFLRAWKARHHYQGEQSRVIGWLLQIAKRLVIDDYRRSQRAARRQPPAPQPATAPEDAAQASDDLRRLEEILSSLPNDPREILVLRYRLNWQVKEIALHMRMTESHVSVIIHRTLAKIRQQWSQTTEGDTHDYDTQ